MKNKLFLMMMVVASSLFLVNCAKDNKNNNQNNGYSCLQYNSAGQCISTGVNYNGGMCPAGQVQTVQGCLPQNAQQCGMSAGYNPATGQCAQLANGGYNNGYNNGVCSPNDRVMTQQFGELTQGACVTACQQNGRKYGYYQGNYNGQYGQWCVPSMY